MASTTTYFHLSPDDSVEVGTQSEIQFRSGFSQPLVLFLPKGQEQKIEQVVALLNEIIFTSRHAKQEAA